MLSFHSSRNIPFTVRLVFEGMGYGAGDGLVHEEAHPLIEFYDARHKDDQRFILGRGRFITRYSAATILDDIRASTSVYGHHLHGDDPYWALSGADMEKVMAWVEEQVQEKARLLNEESALAPSM